MCMLIIQHCGIKEPRYYHLIPLLHHGIAMYCMYFLQGVLHLLYIDPDTVSKIHAMTNTSNMSSVRISMCND